MAANYDYRNVMKLYEKIKALGPEYKAKADSFMASLSKQYSDDSPAPPEIVQRGLEDILAESNIGKGIESKASTDYNPIHNVFGQLTHPAVAGAAALAFLAYLLL